MIDYKERFIKAKKEMDKRKEKNIEEKCWFEADNDNIIKLGEADGKTFFEGMNDLIWNQLEYFIICMNQKNINPPFNIKEEIELVWSEIQVNGEYRKAFILTLSNLIEENLKSHTPNFCNFKVRVNDKTKRIYYPKIGKYAYKVKIQIDVTLAFIS